MRESGATNSHRPFPDKPYFRSVLDEIQREPVLFIEKSRDTMISWLCVGFLTHGDDSPEAQPIDYRHHKKAHYWAQAGCHVQTADYTLCLKSKLKANRRSGLAELTAPFF